jgi:hypothetical protein
MKITTFEMSGRDNLDVAHPDAADGKVLWKAHS